MMQFEEVCGPSKEAMIFGFNSCGWNISLFDYLSVKGITCRYYDGSGSDRVIRTNCKTMLTNLIVENAERQKNGLPLIPLIFLVANKNESLNIKKVATSLFNGKDFTDSELRRCYKIFTHDNPLVRNLAERTIKFVKLTRSTVKVGYSLIDHYFCEELPPFWTHVDWSKGWEQRQSYRKKINKTAQGSWRRELTDKILDFLSDEIYQLLSDLQDYRDKRTKKMQSELGMHNFFRDIMGFSAKNKIDATNNLINKLLTSSNEPFSEIDLKALLEPNSELRKIIFKYRSKPILPQELNEKLSDETVRELTTSNRFSNQQN